MRKFDQHQAIAVIELEQMVSDYFVVLDSEGGGAALGFFTEDVVVDIGVISYTGHAGMKKFYEGIAASKAAVGARTGRHGFINFRVIFPEKNRANVTFLNVTWTASGKPPLADATLPSIITDVRMQCRLEADGQWKVFHYSGSPIFVGNDSEMKKIVVGK
jgi:ketosteroid isomerase-like protein